MPTHANMFCFPSAAHQCFLFSFLLAVLLVAHLFAFFFCASFLLLCLLFSDRAKELGLDTPRVGSLTKNYIPPSTQLPSQSPTNFGSRWKL